MKDIPIGGWAPYVAPGHSEETALGIEFLENSLPGESPHLSCSEALDPETPGQVRTRFLSLFLVKPGADCPQSEGGVLRFGFRVVVCS